MASGYRDPRLPGASAPLVDASLIWSATPLTTVTLKAQSAIADAVIAGASADIQHGYTLDVSHALTRQIALGVSAGYATDAYVGVPQRDSTMTLGLKGEYHLNREVVLKGERDAPAIRLQRRRFELCRRRLHAGGAAAAMTRARLSPAALEIRRDLFRGT